MAVGCTVSIILAVCGNVGPIYRVYCAPGPAVMLTAEGMSELICLTCPQHEEADTRIFAHAAYLVSNQGCTRAVIKATDTDIAVLGVYHSQRMQGFERIMDSEICHCAESRYTNISVSSMPPDYRRVVIQVPRS